MSHTAAATDTAQALVEARRLDIRLTDYPGPFPPSLKSAYKIQDAAIALRGTDVAGWKVGKVADDLMAEFGTERLAGPVFADTIVQVRDGQTIERPVLKGFAAVEAELMLRIGGPTAFVKTAEDAWEIVDEVRFGFEIASSPYTRINEHGPAVTASDFGNNFGLVLGPVIEDWRARDILNAPVELRIDDVEAGRGKAGDTLDGPFGAVAFIAQLMRLRGIDLKPGTWISTGAITGVHPIRPGQSASAVFDNRERVQTQIVASA
jgi:2-keto-4-pentenoate hydratase